ncbi:MAG: VCBS repeat-containing protein, partial [Thermoleophilia bacterium]
MRSNSRTDKGSVFHAIGFGGSSFGKFKLVWLSLSGALLMALIVCWPGGSAEAAATVTFAPAVNYGVGQSPSSVTTGDFNGDGKTDLAVANQSSNDVSVLIGNGNGGFDSAGNTGVGSQPSSVTTGDFNGDGKADLAEANE